MWSGGVAVSRELGRSGAGGGAHLERWYHVSEHRVERSGSRRMGAEEAWRSGGIFEKVSRAQHDAERPSSDYQSKIHEHPAAGP